MPKVGRRRKTRWVLGITVGAIAVFVIIFRGWKVEKKESGPAPDATALAWLCGALETRSPRSAIQSFPDVRRAEIKDEDHTEHGWGRHDLTVRVGAWNLKASYYADAFNGISPQDYKIETDGTAGAKIFRSLDDAKKWLGRFGAIREVPPTYSVTLLDSTGAFGAREDASVSATYTNTRQSLEFQFSAYALAQIVFKPLCTK